MTPGREDMVLKRTRESTSKVRTGCSTCKARRVKCDETKPTCRRCATGSRKCDYNTARAVIPRNRITVYLPPIQSQPVFFINDRGLDFFQQNLAAKLDGHFDSDLWNKLVLQLSHSEPSVRHAVSAISITYRDIESSLQHPAGYVIANPEARQEWNAAVKSLSARIQAFGNSNLVPLVCCLLFTCIGFLRGDIESSMLHVQNGFKILAALPHDIYEVSNRSVNDISIIEDHLAPVFSRLAVLFSLTGRIISTTIAPPRVRDESPQEDLVDSRLRLYQISHAVFAFVREVAPKAATFEIEVDDLVDQVKIQTRLETWYSQLGDLLKRMEASGNSPKQAALSVLLVNYKVISIWIRVCTIACESGTDSYHDDFKEIVYHAEQCVKADMGDATPQPVSFDMQILAPLYYTTLKCRNPTTRRRALELLRLTPRREALWNAHHAYVTAKRVIEVEELHLNGQEWPNETSRVHHLPFPDEESRVHNPGETAFDFGKFNDGIVQSPAYPGTVKVEFQMKPWGLMGEWHTVTEYINL